MPHPTVFGCTAVTQQCTIENSIYGYYPDLGANIFFAAIFGICCVVQLVLGTRTRSWVFMGVLAVGAFAEGLGKSSHHTSCVSNLSIGYIGRAMLHYNPYSNIGFEIQICCLIMAPVRSMDHLV